MHKILAVLRLVRGWDQSELAAASGVRRSSISDYERAKSVPDLQTLERLVAGMGFPLSAIDSAHQFIRSFNPEPPQSLEDVAARVESIAAEAGQVVANLVRSTLELLAQETLTVKYPLAPKEADRQEAAALWERLKDLSAGDQTALLAGYRGPHVWAVVERLCQGSIAVAIDQPDRSLQLAKLAVMVSSQSAGEPAWLALIRAFAWAHLGNAQRVQGDMRSAEEAFGEADRLWTESGDRPTGLLEAAQVPALKASLRRTQGRHTEALALLGVALGLEPAPALRASILINKARTLEESGDLVGAIGALREAEPLVDRQADPRLYLCVRHNLVDGLSKADRYEEAASLLPDVKRLARRFGTGLDRLRLTWIEGRVEAGLGRTAGAIDLLQQVRGTLADRGIGYDTALVSLELAIVYAAEGRTAEVKALARHMVPIFQSGDVHKEALAALAVFRQAAEKERVTAELARKIATFLAKARHDPGLRFEQSGG